MSRINAIYRHGVFQPLEPVAFHEEQRVRLSIEATPIQTPQEWLDQLKTLHAAIVVRQGLLPDSAPEIAADRWR